MAARLTNGFRPGCPEVCSPGIDHGKGVTVLADGSVHYPVQMPGHGKFPALGMDHRIQKTIDNHHKAALTVIAFPGTPTTVQRPGDHFDKGVIRLVFHQSNDTTPTHLLSVISLRLTTDHGQLGDRLGHCGNGRGRTGCAAGGHESSAQQRHNNHPLYAHGNHRVDATLTCPRDHPADELPSSVAAKP